MEIDKNDKGMLTMEPITPQGANTVQPGNMVMRPEIWRDIFDAIEDPAFFHDAQFRVMLANRAYCRAAGVTEAQALGKPYRAALGIDNALQEIERGRGTVYDAAVVDACLRLFAEQRFTFSS